MAKHKTAEKTCVVRLGQDNAEFVKTIARMSGRRIPEALDMVVNEYRKVARSEPVRQVLREFVRNGRTAKKLVKSIQLALKGVS